MFLLIEEACQAKGRESEQIITADLQNGKEIRLLTRMPVPAPYQLAISTIKSMENNVTDPPKGRANTLI